MVSIFCKFILGKKSYLSFSGAARLVDYSILHPKAQTLKMVFAKYRHYRFIGETKDQLGLYPLLLFENLILQDKKKYNRNFFLLVKVSATASSG